MAVTIEELQILLKCDATQAQAALTSLNQSVDKAVEKMSQGGKSGNKTWYETMSKRLENATKKMSDAYDRFNETGDSGAKADLGYYATQAKKAATELSKFRDVATKAFGGRSRDGAIGNAIENMSYLDKSVQKVSDHVKRMPNFNKYLLGEAPSEPTVEYRGQKANAPWKDQWSAVTQNDLMSGAGGDMMRRAAAWMNNAQNELGSKFQSVDTEKLTNGSAYERLREQLKVAENQAESLRQKIAAIGDSDNPQALMTLQTKLDTAEKKAEKLAKQMAAIEDGVAPTAGSDTTADSMRKTGEAAQEATPKVEKYAKAKEKAGAATSSFSKASKFAHGIFDRFGKSFKKHDGFLSQFGRTLKRVVMRMLAMGLIRGVINGIRQGLQMLAKTSSTAAEQFGRFSAMGKAIKVALGSAALSVLNALSGVLYSIAQAAVTAANAVAQFFAVISGSGKYIGVTLAGSFDDLGDSIGGAGGKAKGLLADFDELNIIGQQSGGGGGGGLNGVSGVTTGEQDAVSVLADLLKNEQFEQAGAYISQKLGEVADKINQWFIDLDNKHYGTKFADLLNGFFSDKSTFEKLGTAVGNGLNVVIHAFTDFFKRFDARSAAESIVTALNTAIKTTDWNSAGEGLGEMLMDLLDFATTFMLEFDWLGLLNGIVNAILTAIEYILSNPVRMLRIIVTFCHGLINLIGSIIIAGIEGILSTIDRVAQLFNPNWTPLAGRLTEKWNGIMDEWETNTNEHFDSLQAAWDKGMGNLGSATESVTEKVDELSTAVSNIPEYKESTIKINTVVSSSGGDSYSGGGSNRPTVNVNLMKMARGGIAYGDTLAHIGEYPSARSNPEVVAPLSKLQDILAKSGNSSADVKRQNELLAEQNRLLRMIAQKEIRLSPTPELGQVVTKAQALYGAV